ncbi:MAG: efflux RND transporter periplasmic adaptor subunit [Methylococcaceae bacterium]
MNIVKTLTISFRLALLMMAIVAVGGCSTEPATQLETIGETHLAGNYQIQIKLNPEKPKIGNNSLTMAIRNTKDQPIVDAVVQIYAEMPAMGSMQAMREMVAIENTGTGLYQGSYSLPMNGSWPLTISIESEKQGKADVLFDMNTSRIGVKLRQATPSKFTTKQQQTPSPKQSLAALNIDDYRRQLIGVTTTEVICENLVKTLRVGARISYDQSRLSDISLQYDAWIGQLNADYLGKQIQQGETLFTVYSPELVSAQDEYLDSLKHGQFSLQKVTQKRLMRWGVNTEQIKAIRKRGRAMDYLSIVSPVNGTVIEKNVVTGSAIKSGSSILRLADLSTVWVEGEVFESDLALVKEGMEASITFPELTEYSYTAKVSFVDSVIIANTHSAVIRVELNNPKGFLKPGMYANMQLQVELGERMVVPEQAVIFSGKQRIVFIDKGDGRLQPTKIKTGVRNDEMIEVLDGLAFGDIVVTSGNFLIAAESKLKAGLAQW